MLRPLYLVVAVCTALLLFLVPAPSRADSVTGDTTLTLDSSTMTSLSGMGLSFSALGKASFDASTMTLVLPITSGTIGATGDTFNHDGSGFSLSSGSADITFRNLVVNTATDTITGNVHFGSTQINGVTLFDIASGGVLTLDAQAAGDISTAFGVANMTGTQIGTAAISIPFTSGSGSSSGSSGPSGSGDPTSTPEPSALGLLVASVLAVGAISLFRSSSRQLRVA